MLRKTTTKIPFDSELAKLAWEGPTDSGKEYQLTDRLGHPVRILCTDRKESYQPLYPIVALVKDDYGQEEPKTYTKDGKFMAVEGKDSLQDLELWEIKKEHVLSNLEQYLADRLVGFSDEDVHSQHYYEIVERAAKDVRALVKKEWPTAESAVSEESEK